MRSLGSDHLQHSEPVMIVHSPLLSTAQGFAAGLQELILLSEAHQGLSWSSLQRIDAGFVVIAIVIGSRCPGWPQSRVASLQSLPYQKVVSGLGLIAYSARCLVASASPRPLHCYYP